MNARAARRTFKMERRVVCALLANRIHIAISYKPAVPISIWAYLFFIYARWTSESWVDHIRCILPQRRSFLLSCNYYGRFPTPVKQQIHSCFFLPRIIQEWKKLTPEFYVQRVPIHVLRFSRLSLLTAAAIYPSPTLDPYTEKCACECIWMTCTHECMVRAWWCWFFGMTSQPRSHQVSGLVSCALYARIWRNEVVEKYRLSAASSSLNGWILNTWFPPRRTILHNNEIKCWMLSCSFPLK